MYIIITLNAKLQPKHRHEIEVIINELFEKHNINAAVTGGGTMQAKNREIEFCDLEIELHEKTFNEKIITIIEAVLAPKGSKIIYGEEETDEKRVIEIGKHEGLGLYFNNNLNKSVYEACDVNVAYEEIDKPLKEKEAGCIASYWEGEETAFYLYGKSFDAMHTIITPFLDTYPLCEKCRIVNCIKIVSIY